MYNRYYGFKENPFNQTPNSSFFYESDIHKHALDTLFYAVHQRKGFVALTGEIGSGKTTLIRTFMRRFGNRLKSALLTNTHISPKGMVTLILEDLEAPYQHGSKDRLLIQLNNYLLNQMSEDQNVVIIIDEAQNLTPACLEEVRMLSNLETESEKLLQIVLVGQPELRKKLDLPQLAQLRQRIAIHYHLDALSREDTKNYIVHRLNKVKCAKEGPRDFEFLFTEEAIETIYRHSHGIPRLINSICDHALLNGFVSEAMMIYQPLAQEASEAVLQLAGGGER